ncbi:hypothetical protein WICANDRAFT_101262 [Wickerhamomyces anomalus NRRL Y-366-8]|uniref:NADP-dependent oxidoreductase domain-containing protein n=1 Tax=Wickerhamomyces anomalus (strain ATCC 58044 / CBS 1984 / NCYC 433 / NRRL Y-366-8) TaxID=683960 RepID=A0A1E3NXL9_WICAA|nr:uncharacterized protein WICANDRAFT_101262 [Wickerhamomyces anomalus NRRL Y-366-8]ODQ57845.1 hypothetical protein WICANDRAFT_101262 [Wickerhamomyces anomalus NRRL Y-366-8]
MQENLPTAILNNGVVMPVFGLGTWQSKPNEVCNAVEFALKNNYRLIDTAAIYGNEHEVGEGIKRSGISRAELFITTKLWNSHHDPVDVEIALDESLNKLGLDYIDLYLMHYPCANDKEMFLKDQYVKADIDFVDTWKAMEGLLESGKVRAIGISNFSLSETQKLLESCAIKPQVHQMEMHPYLKQSEFLDFHKKNDIHVTAYSAFDNEPKILSHPSVLEISKRLGKPASQLLVSWAIKRGTSIIPKTVTFKRILENYEGHDLECPGKKP